MSNEYSYRDAKLSLWQAAAHEVAAKHPTIARSREQSSTVGTISHNIFMVPAHVVGHSLLMAGRPFAWLDDEIKKDILKLFHPMDSCAESAARFLSAELAGKETDSKVYAAQLRDGECNAIDWGECLTAYLQYKALLLKPLYRANENVIVELKENTRIAILSDWGTGADVAINLLEQIAALKPDVLIHLGDVYFAATLREVKANFLELCSRILPNTRVFTLCGNHDMYSGGEGYYWLLDQIGQKASYFSLLNEHWVFQAMDTGYHDGDPFNVGSNMTSLVEKETWSEASWHLDKIKQAGDRRIVLLSHHQPFSAFGSVGSIDNTSYAYNPHLCRTFESVLPRTEWWFWGHEHTLAVFAPYMGVNRGRCVGASAVPVYSDQQSYVTAPGLTTSEGQGMPVWADDCELGVTDDMYNNCFAILSLDGASAIAEYYEVPPMQTARRYQSVDQV